jgi:hypothetical protein
MGAKKVVESREEIRTRVCQSVAMDPDLDGVDLRVFLYLCTVLNFDEPLHHSQLELALCLGRRKEHISRAIRRLTEAGILLPGPQGNRASKWKLNPDYGKEKGR